MKKSISYWSFEGGLEGKKNINECFREAKFAGFDAVELCLGETGALGLDTTEKKCRQILKDAKEANIKISSLATGLYWDYSLTDPDPLIREKAVDITKKLLQIANWLKLDTVLVVPGAVDVFFKPDFNPVAYDIVYKRSMESLKKVVPLAAKLKVTIGIENVWNKFLLSPLEMKQFIDSFKSKYVGVYFDVGNVLLLGYPQHWIEILGSRIKKVHFKDFKKSFGTAEGFCDLTEGDINWKEVMKSFKKIKYNGYCTAEMMPFRPDLLKKTSQAMGRIFSL